MNNSPRPRQCCNPCGQVLTGYGCQSAAPGDRQGITRGGRGRRKNTTMIADFLRGQW
jgi:hypothetical protein